jgi:spermidine synthase
LKNTIDRRLIVLVIATGIASVASQLVFVREYLAQFQGNEIVVALVLFVWLILGGVGTRLARLSKSPSKNLLCFLCFGLSALAVVQIAAVRALRPLIFLPAEAVGFYAILSFTLLTMAPYALLVGFVLPYTLYVLRIRAPNYPGVSLYMADNIGDVCGGALFAFCLVFWTTPMQALAIANLPLIIAALRLIPHRWIGWMGATVSAAVLVSGVLVEARLLRPFTGELVAYKESQYARLTVQKDGSQLTLFADGRPLAGNQSVMSAEMHAHYPLSQLDRVNRVLIVSAIGGLTAELAKYHPTEIEYVELDPATANLVDRFGIMPRIRGMRVIQADARAWLRRSNRRYDAILMNLDEPATYQLNRFFTEGFIALVKDRLNSQGIFSFSVQGFANYPTQQQRRKISILAMTARRHFSHVEILPGERLFFLCGQQPLDLNIPERLQALGIATQFVGPYYDGVITPQRIEQVRGIIDQRAPANTDSRPLLMGVMFDQWFAKFGASQVIFWVVLAALSIIYMLRLKREEYILFTTGMTAMGSEILVIFAFQIYLGYIYFKIGALVTVFLAGLLPGAWLGRRWSGRSKQALLVSDLFLIFLVLTFVLVLRAGGETIPQGFYYACGFLISVAGGFQFPLVLARLGDTRAFATRIFAVDLVGAACGALVISTVLIPRWGLMAAAGVLVAFKLTSFLIMGHAYVLRSSTHLSIR